MSEIVLYFNGRTNGVGRFIGLGTGGFPYHHVGAYMTRAPFKKGDLVSAHWEDGLQVRTDADEGGWKFWAYVHIPCTDEQADNAAKWLKAHVGERYARGAIFEMAWRTLTSCGAPSHWPSQWVCSSGMMGVLCAVGLYPQVKPMPIRLFTPRDVFVLSLALPGASWSQRMPP